MAINKFQRSKVDLCPFSQGRSYCGPINILNLVFSQTIDPIELIFHVKTPYDKILKMYSKNLSHMTEMAARPIHGKNPLKIFFSRSRRPVTLGLGM